MILSGNVVEFADLEKKFPVRQKFSYRGYQVVIVWNPGNAVPREDPHWLYSICSVNGVNGGTYNPYYFSQVQVVYGCKKSIDDWKEREHKILKEAVKEIERERQSIL